MRLEGGEKEERGLLHGKRHQEGFRFYEFFLILLIYIFIFTYEIVNNIC